MQALEHHGRKGKNLHLAHPASLADNHARITFPRCQDSTEAAMPSLFKFLAMLGILGGLGFAGMMAVVMFVEPQPREMSIAIPPSKLGK